VLELGSEDMKTW